LFGCGTTTACYYDCGHDMKRTWSQAENFCGMKGVGCLVAIASAAESSCVAQHTLPTGSDSVWIGYQQAASGVEPDGGWSWVCSPSSYVSWAITEPNNLTGDEDCGAIKDSGASYFDEVCTKSFRFVCELTPVVPDL
jgi:hypothetical protein